MNDDHQADDPTPSDLDIGGALARLDALDPVATGIVRRALLGRRPHPLDRILQYLVEPQWAHVLAAAEALADGRRAEAEATIRLAAAMEARTALWREHIVPKLLPAVGTLIAVCIAWLAATLGLPPTIGLR